MKTNTIPVLLLAASVFCAAEIFTPKQLADLNGFVENVMTCSNLPGLTLTAVKGGEVFTKGYGKRDVENDKNTTADTVFCIGSLTKAMTTTLLAKLLPEKFPKSKWDTKLKDILGDSFELSTAELTDHVRLRDVLSHRTGLVNGDYGIFAGYPDSITRSNMAKKLQYLPSSQPLRYHYEYNNWMYFLAGYVAEVLAGKVESWEDLLSRHILKPLEMDSTVLLKSLNELAERTELALPYIFTNGSHKRMPSELFSLYPAEPAGAVCSSAIDMSKWIKFLLHSPKTIVNETAFNDTMRAVQITPIYGYQRPDYPTDSYSFGYGMGWFTGAYRGRYQVLHSGGLFAYTSLLWLFPQSEAGVFVSINGMNETGNPKHVILSYISDIMLGEIPWLNSTTACSFPEPWKGNSDKNSSQSNHTDHPDVKAQRPLSDYVGVYGNGFIGDVHIFINNTSDRLQLRLGERLEARLYPTHQKDVFQWELTGLFSFLADPDSSSSEKVHFSLNSNGQINSLTSSAIGRAFTFRTDVRFDGTSSANTFSGGRIWTHFLLGFLFCFYLLMGNIS